MKKVLLVITGVLVCANVNVAHSAVAVKKAAPVAAQKQTVTDSVSSLLPTAVGLFTSVQQLTKQQKELTAECVPTSQEISFVDTTMKEWAKTGAKTADEALKSINSNMKCCDPASSMARDYATSVKNAAEMEMPDLLCYDCFTSASDKGTIWENYPKVGMTSYCPDGAASCKNKKTVSNIYEVFNVIDFSSEDYNAQELTMASKIMSKIENCSATKLSARKTALWGEFLMGTISNVGQPTNTGDVMNAVGGILNSGGGLSGLGSLGSIATQLLDK